MVALADQGTDGDIDDGTVVVDCSVTADNLLIVEGVKSDVECKGHVTLEI